MLARLNRTVSATGTSTGSSGGTLSSAVMAFATEVGAEIDVDEHGMDDLPGRTAARLLALLSQFREIFRPARQRRRAAQRTRTRT